MIGSSKMEILKTDFFDTLIIQKDEVSYVKHVLTPLYVFFTLFGCRRGGVPKGLQHTCLCFMGMGMCRASLRLGRPGCAVAL